MEMKQAHILLVDDEQSILQMVEMVMQKEGFQNIHKATTGHEALQIVKATPLDYIVLDVMLPDTNGFDLCKKICEYTDDHILLFTANVTDFVVLTGVEGSGDVYMVTAFHMLYIVTIQR